MVLASPVLGRNNHQPLSRHPACSSSATEPSFLAGQFAAQPQVTPGHASSIFFPNNSNAQSATSAEASANFHPHQSYLKQNNNMQDSNCWTNLFSNQLSTSTPSLNSAEQHGSNKLRSPQRILGNGSIHQLVSPSTGSYPDVHPLLGACQAMGKTNQLMQVHSSPDTISAQQQQQNQQNQKQQNPKLYKTELCRSWVDTGRCNYGERCQYAHGDNEKRPIPRHPKYKTEACQSYHKTGYCPYGPRCHFIHNEDPQVLAGLVAAGNNSTSNNTPALSSSFGGSSSGSNPNLMLLRQMSSLGSSSTSSPTTPQHGGLQSNKRMLPPPTAYGQLPPNNSQHQPLAMTHSWCIGGGGSQNNSSQYLTSRASNPLAEAQSYMGGQRNDQHMMSNPFYSPLPHQQHPNTMRMPVRPAAFSPQANRLFNPNATAQAFNNGQPNNTNSITGASSDGGDSSPTSSPGDSGTESPSLGSGSYSPGEGNEGVDGVTNFCRLSPTSFRTSLMLLNGDSGARRNSEGGSTVLAESSIGAEPSSSPNSSASFSSPFSSPSSRQIVQSLQEGGQGAAVAQPTFPSLLQLDEESMVKLAKDLTDSMKLSHEHNNGPFESAESIAETLRRASGSSLGSAGHGADNQSSSASSSANMTTNTSSTASSDAEWSMSSRQVLGRLPVFERLSNGPF